ncbi:unnamed protein product [Amoebophrya sp. A120]|nr:unnamed protein product [Amoebophrya sp. A120]|eukprot:GSA120T00020549001.1
MRSFSWTTSGAVPFSLFCFLYYVVAGSTHLLLTKATENKNASGRLEYDTTVVVSLVEVFKAIFAINMVLLFGKKNNGTTKSEIAELCKLGEPRYALPGLFYAVQNNCIILAVPLLHPHVFGLFNNLKIVSAAVFSSLFLRKRFRVREKVGLLLLILSCVVSKWEMATSAVRQLMIRPNNAAPDERRQSATMKNAKGEAEDQRFLLGLSLTLFATSVSGLAGVINEHVLKVGGKVGHSFWIKNYYTYQYGILFNLCGNAVSYLLQNYHPGMTSGVLNTSNASSFSNTTKNSSDLFLKKTSPSLLLTGFTPLVWALVFVWVLLGVSVSLVFKYLDNTAKSFGNPLIVFVTSIFSHFLFADTNLDVYFFQALALYFCSVAVYSGTTAPFFQVTGLAPPGGSFSSSSSVATSSTRNFISLVTESRTDTDADTSTIREKKNA